ncbi:MAG: glycosyltransferase family 25 protein [Hyphomonadaceae bacterium]
MKLRLNVINLPSRQDRRTQFSAWNARPGIEIAFVDAVRGADVDRAALVREHVLDPTFELSDGALGNALSNRGLWLEARHAAEPLVVCEDDACLRGDFVQRAEAAIDQAGADWDIIFFGYNTNATVAVEGNDGLKTLLHFDEAAKREPGYFDGFTRLSAPPPALLRCYQAWGTLCYAISPKGADVLLEACFPLSANTKIVMFGQNRLLAPYTLDGMINVALQRSRVASFCCFPPLAVSSNDVASSDVVSR